jgi:DnaJ-class molecular chaperone
MPIIEDCVSCKGKGKFEIVDMEDPDVFRIIPCEVCHGTGKVSS